eukprot:snap_masked-scaffold_36-processed-gene-2.45-mRNA-1 protein AED:1.00 eAED:1.00 QI:0/-1/0/0/-1/1/1/0/182
MDGVTKRSKQVGSSTKVSAQAHRDKVAAFRQFAIRAIDEKKIDTVEDVKLKAILKGFFEVDPHLLYQRFCKKLKGFVESKNLPEALAERVRIYLWNVDVATAQLQEQSNKKKQNSLIKKINSKEAKKIRTAIRNRKKDLEKYKLVLIVDMTTFFGVWSDDDLIDYEKVKLNARRTSMKLPEV